jgi:hypothetical protein
VNELSFALLFTKAAVLKVRSLSRRAQGARALSERKLSRSESSLGELNEY